MTTRREFLAGAAGAASWLGAGGALARAGAPARRVFAAGPPAAVLVQMLAPEALLGWPGALPPETRAWLGPPASELPVLGRLAGRGSTVSLETLVGLRTDLVLDVGSVDDTRESAAARVRRQTGLRYELLGGRLAESAALLRQAGALLGVAERGERLAREAGRILGEVEAARARLAGTRVYLARGADGLETGRAGSLNAEALEIVGARNVAAVTGPGGLLRVSLEQVLSWDPEVVLTQDPGFARTAASSPVWRTTADGRARRVLLAPTVPFGWIDAPPGPNRLVGVLWLSRSLDPRPPADDLRERVLEHYDAFYGIALDAARLDFLLGGDDRA
jgi:iron complex transport system substrate-binding protein